MDPKRELDLTLNFQTVTHAPNLDTANASKRELDLRSKF